MIHPQRQGKAQDVAEEHDPTEGQGEVRLHSELAHEAKRVVTHPVEETEQAIAAMATASGLKARLAFAA